MSAIPLGNIEKFAHAVVAGISVLTAADMADIAAKESFPRIPGCYVYLLADPRDESVFYIGKGVHERWRQHLLQYRRRFVQNRAKHNRIGEIVRDRLEPVAYILQSGLTDQAAFRLEQALIRAIGFKNLTNKQAVSGSTTLLGKITDMWRRLKPVGVWASEEPRSERDLEIYWFIYDNVCDLKATLEYEFAHGKEPRASAA